MPYTPSLKIEEIRAISNGTHPDPFSVLGLHHVECDGKTSLVARTFQPDAKRVALHPAGGKPAEMIRISEEGVFELPIPRRKKRFAYRLEVENHAGEVRKIEDPYRFGRLTDDFDLQLWVEGNHQKAWKWMGAHIMEVEGVRGARFVVCAPDAAQVSVVGTFNNWDGRVHPMRRYPNHGIWEIFIPGVGKGDLYKYQIRSRFRDEHFLKADPYAQMAELRPGTASVVWEERYTWQDSEWMEKRAALQAPDRPLAIYEVHAGSWRRKAEEEPGFLNYRELAEELIPWLQQTGYTHVQLLPVAEHPYDPSWGYQLTGYYAVTSRYGTPGDFRYFVDRCHQAGIGVILDWVPGHFARDAHGLVKFDGTSLYEHADPRQGEHADWGTLIFNYGRTEVINFLISNAVYWLEEFHLDGIRVDAVASMLYLDYSREEGEWVPNKFGGRENLEAIHFLRRFNQVVHDRFPGILTVAEESTSWEGVTAPVDEGGLGFDYKWNMGWMNDTLSYFSKDPVYRKHHHGQLTFSMIYAFSESFILPLSHDEVVHMKQSLLSKMPGDDWQKFANLRLLYTYQYTHPGKKLLFMGGEIAQWGEWSQDRSLDWHLLQWENHQGMRLLVSDLNRLYRQESPLHEADTSWEGFEWIDFRDKENSIVSWIRRAPAQNEYLVVVLNFTPEVHHGYRIGVPEAGKYDTIFNSDSRYYQGSNTGNAVAVAVEEEWHGKPFHLSLTIPPLAGIILKPRKKEDEK